MGKVRTWAREWARVSEGFKELVRGHDGDGESALRTEQSLL